VLTLCRSRSHDLHYFNVPESITGDPPPPPFLANDHLDIPLRLLRKVWLSAAFALIRRRLGAAYPGDDAAFNDTHGEFIPAHTFYGDWERWSVDLRQDLENTAETRDGFAKVLGAGIPGRARDLISHTNVDILTTASAIRALRSFAISTSIMGNILILPLTGGHRTRPTLLRSNTRRPLTNQPGGTTLILRGKLFRQPKPALCAAQNHVVSGSLERCITVPAVAEVCRPQSRHS